jgi:hypothetical protein
VRDDRNLFPALHELGARQVVLEFAIRGLGDLECLQGRPARQGAGRGQVDVKAFKPETAADLAGRAP